MSLTYTQLTQETLIVERYANLAGLNYMYKDYLTAVFSHSGELMYRQHYHCPNNDQDRLSSLFCHALYAAQSLPDRSLPDINNFKGNIFEFMQKFILCMSDYLDQGPHYKDEQKAEGFLPYPECVD